jgi:hypothetical protein
MNEKNFDWKENYMEVPPDTNKIGDNSTVGDDDEITKMRS